MNASTSFALFTVCCNAVNTDAVPGQVHGHRFRPKWPLHEPLYHTSVHQFFAPACMTPDATSIAAPSPLLSGHAVVQQLPLQEGFLRPASAPVNLKAPAYCPLASVASIIPCYRPCSSQGAQPCLAPIFLWATSMFQLQQLSAVLRRNFWRKQARDASECQDQPLNLRETPISTTESIASRHAGQVALCLSHARRPTCLA